MVCLIIELRGTVCEARKAAVVSVCSKINFLIEDRSAKVSYIIVGGAGEVSPDSGRWSR